MSAVAKGPAHSPIHTLDGAPEVAVHATFKDGHPFEGYRRMRAHAPVLWRDQPEPYEPGFWALSRHADICAVAKNADVWSSANGAHLQSLGDPDLMPLDVIAPIVGNMVSMDPPEHTAYRRIAMPGFTPQRIASMEAKVRARAIELIESAARKRETDFVEDIAQMLPLFTLTEILGVPEADRPKVLGWANMLASVHDEKARPAMGDLMTAFMEMYDYGRWSMEQRRLEPKDDIMSILATAKLESGEVLPPTALDGFFLIMVFGGNDTTRNTLSGGLWALTQFPDQKKKLIDNPALIPNAVDEMLRFVSPVIYFSRRAKVDTQIREQKIKAGEKVVLLYGSANRDEEVFVNADEFDVERANARQHLAFGHGHHFCLGGRFGLLQLRIFFEELLKRYPNTVATAPPDRLQSNFVLGVRGLPVRFIA